MGKKLRELMSMITFNKTEKSRIWNYYYRNYGNVKTTTIIKYLKYHVSLRNQGKWQELIGYLEKHQPRVINYNRRRRSGKTISRGQIKKEFNLTV